MHCSRISFCDSVRVARVTGGGIRAGGVSFGDIRAGSVGVGGFRAGSVGVRGFRASGVRVGVGRVGGVGVGGFRASGVRVGDGTCSSIIFKRSTWCYTVGHAVHVAAIIIEIRLAAYAVSDSFAIFFAFPATRATKAVVVAYHPIVTFGTVFVCSQTVGHAVIVARLIMEIRLAARAVSDSLAICIIAIPAARVTVAPVIAYHLIASSGLMNLGEFKIVLLQVESSSVSSNANGCEKLHCLEVFVVFVLFINFSGKLIPLYTP